MPLLWAEVSLAELVVVWTEVLAGATEMLVLMEPMEAGRTPFQLTETDEIVARPGGFLETRS